MTQDQIIEMQKAFIGNANGCTIDRYWWMPADPEAKVFDRTQNMYVAKPRKEHVEVSFAMNLEGRMTRRSMKFWLSDRAIPHSVPQLQSIGITVIPGIGITKVDPDLHNKAWPLYAKRNEPYGVQWSMNKGAQSQLIDKTTYQYPVNQAAPQAPQQAAPQQHPQQPVQQPQQSYAPQEYMQALQQGFAPQQPAQAAPAPAPAPLISEQYEYNEPPF